MEKGGIHDHIGHGFARYSVTADWSLPHFEKMLYDQAQLLEIYIDAWLLTKSQSMLDAANDIAEYMCLDALKNPDGGFFSSEDADSLYRRADTEKRGMHGHLSHRPLERSDATLKRELSMFGQGKNSIPFWGSRMPQYVPSIGTSSGMEMSIQYTTRTTNS